MCMIDYSDPCEVCTTKIHKARKFYRCIECGAVIHPGETYQRAFTVQDGEASTYFMCDECRKAAAWLMRECGGYCFGGVLEDLSEHWHGDGIRTMELGRLIVLANLRRKVVRFMAGKSL